MKKNYFLIIIFGFLISCSENKIQSVDFSIVIHGGAGTDYILEAIGEKGKFA